MRAVRRTWTIGGVGLVTTGVVGMLWSAAPMFGSLFWVVSVLFSASVLFFAIGLSREASVVRRRPLGVTALTVLALWPFASMSVSTLLPQMDQATYEAGLDAYRAAETAGTWLFFIDLVVSLAAGIVAVVQIARAGTIPRPWRWAPLWALAVQVAAGVFPQLAFTFLGPTQSQDVLGLVSLIGQLGFLARTLGLGILALVLAARVRPGSVDVLGSTTT